jgi:hypothetical protein
LKRKILAIMLLVVLVALALEFVHGMPDMNQPPRHPPWRPRFNETDPETLERIAQRIEMMIKGKIIISSINMILYAYIAFFYISLYSENRSKFSLSLTSLALVLFIYSISSNPLILFYIGRAERVWLAAFNFIPDLFSTLAAVILLYLSRT